LLLWSINSIFAASVEEACFETLKENMSDILPMKTPYNIIKNMEYRELENNFSRLYKNNTSF
jgi:hypothetical protein